MHECVLNHFSCVWFFVTLWMVAYHGSLSMVFSRQEYRSGFPYLPPGDLPNPGIKPPSLTLASKFFITRTTKCILLGKKKKKKIVLSRLHLHEYNYMTFWKRQNYRDNKISKKKNIEILREIKNNINSCQGKKDE